MGTVATTCEYTINPVASSPAVCQVRLDFDAFVLRQPNSAGLCNTDTITFTSPTGSNVALPRLCGTLTDQHSNKIFSKNLNFLNQISFSNFSCRFLNPNNFSNLNYNYFTYFLRSEISPG